ncbi:MAG TPA: DUF401 family protein [Nitrospirae bacterium]|nr:DUF401 family protein [Nitrospirota bacterium]
MVDILILTAAMVIILLLLRRKWNVGYVLMIASLFLILTYRLTPDRILLVVKNTLTAPITLDLLIALTFIRIFEYILRDARALERMMKAMRGIFRNKKSVIISMPLLIGMLPSVGGAYFSAPMVDEATRDTPLTPEEKTFTNYWYRHPWEFILPLYPGIILASVLTSIEVRTFILYNLPYALTMFITGFFVLNKVHGKYPSIKGNPREIILTFLPLIWLLVMVIVFKIPLHYALVILVLSLFVIYRYPVKKIKEAFRYGFSLNVITLIIGVILFKETLELSGAVNNISIFFSEKEIPLLPVLFLLPFLTGLLTGLTVGFVGSSFPLIITLTGHDPLAFTFAFAAGFLGVLISPVHVCLILTREYFKADIMGTYRKIFPAAGAVLIVALIEYFILRH